eukprot:5571591-Pleurochrysis_carterae.AAC.2
MRAYDRVGLRGIIVGCMPSPVPFRLFVPFRASRKRRLTSASYAKSELSSSSQHCPKQRILSHSKLS